MTYLDLMFSDWGEWSFCSASCDSGSRTRSRTCTANCHKVDNDNLYDKESCLTRECCKYISLKLKVKANKLRRTNF